jgi:hypothetical protein
MGGLDGLPKPELSTLLGIGTFYFALTGLDGFVLRTELRDVRLVDLLERA